MQASQIIQQEKYVTVNSTGITFNFNVIKTQNIKFDSSLLLREVLIKNKSEWPDRKDDIKDKVDFFVEKQPKNEKLAFPNKNDMFYLFPNDNLAARAFIKKNGKVVRTGILQENEINDKKTQKFIEDIEKANRFKSPEKENFIKWVREGTPSNSPDSKFRDARNLAREVRGVVLTGELSHIDNLLDLTIFQLKNIQSVDDVSKLFGGGPGSLFEGFGAAISQNQERSIILKGIMDNIHKTAFRESIDLLAKNKSIYLKFRKDNLSHHQNNLVIALKLTQMLYLLDHKSYNLAKKTVFEWIQCNQHVADVFNDIASFLNDLAKSGATLRDDNFRAAINNLKLALGG